MKGSSPADCAAFSISGSLSDLRTAVPAPVVLVTVPVVLSILLVVLVVVRNDIVQREAVVAGDEVDALLGFASSLCRRCLGCRAGDRPCVLLDHRAPRKKSRTSSRK